MWWGAFSCLEAVVAVREGRCHGGVRLLCSNAKVGGACQSNIRTDPRTQGFAAKHYIVKRLMLFTRSVSGFNVVAERCITNVFAPKVPLRFLNLH